MEWYGTVCCAVWCIRLQSEHGTYTERRRGKAERVELVLNFLSKSKSKSNSLLSKESCGSWILLSFILLPCISFFPFFPFLSFSFWVKRSLRCHC